PSQLALAWCKQVPGVTSTIIGATTCEQLNENIDAFSISLSKEVLDSVHGVLREHPMGF
ncbi:MAG: aldo/keto reductase, partial [Pseudomonadota bacterium]|nr:aldo/keto reductase [Pseudomonadota bacterium]